MIDQIHIRWGGATDGKKLGDPPCTVIPFDLELPHLARGERSFSVIDCQGYLALLYSTLFAVPLNNSHVKTTKNKQIIVLLLGRC